jgi:hypothetical protein
MKKIALALLFLTGCDREEKPQPPTPEESARLEEAEQMLNELASNEVDRPAPEHSAAP